MFARAYIHLLRWSFDHFYGEFSWTYDTVAAIVSRGLWSRWIEAVIPQLVGERVLELGSGTGYLQRALAAARVECAGVDASPQMLRLARDKVLRSGARPRLLRADARALPVADGSFSDVVATFPAEYILDPATHAEARRVLRSGGRFVLLDAALFSRRDAYSYAVEAAYRVTGQIRQDDPRPALLEAAGFAVSEQWLEVAASRVQLFVGTKM